MFRCAGLKCQQIRGLAKCSIYQIGKMVPSTNTWAAVLIDNTWRLVEPQWGSTTISNPNTGEWVPLDEVGTSK